MKSHQCISPHEKAQSTIFPKQHVGILNGNEICSQKDASLTIISQYTQCEQKD